MSAHLINPIVRLAVLALLVLGLSGCEAARDALGLSKSSPDESGVTVFSPLVVPPDFNLRPPGPGAVNTATLPTTSRRPRQTAVLTDDGRILGGASGSDKVPEDASVGELALLRQAGALTPPSGIRGLAVQQEQAADRLNRLLTELVLFDRKVEDQRQPAPRERSSISRQRSFF